MILDAGHPVSRVVVLIAGDEAPEADAVDEPRSGPRSMPPVVRVQDATDLRVVDVGGVPETELADDGSAAA